MIPDDLLEEAKATRLDMLGPSFDPFFPTVCHWRDKGMTYSWIFKWIQERRPELADDRHDSFCSSMATRYRNRLKKLLK